MAMFIQTNVSSMIAQNSLAKTQASTSQTFARLSSGFRINGAADDAAGLGVSQNLNAQVRSYAVAERNANDGMSMAQTADGAAGQLHELLTRMRELAVQSSNGTLQTVDRTNLDTEFQGMLSEIDRISNVSQFNGKNLLSGAATTVAFQVGIGTSSDDQISVSFGGATASGLAVNGLDLTSVTNAQAAITALDAGSQTLSTIREGFGAVINRLQGAVSNLQSIRSNTAASLSRIRDVDVAEETATMTKNQVLTQAGTAVLAQANQAPQTALSLLRG